MCTVHNTAWQEHKGDNKKNKKGWYLVSVPAKVQLQGKLFAVAYTLRTY